MPIARYKDLCIDTTDRELVAGFWADALRLKRLDVSDTDARLSDSEPTHTVWVNAVPEAKQGWNRVHVDLLGDPAPYLAAGATVVMEPFPGQSWRVLRDPEGNEFCVFPPEPGEPSALVTSAAEPEAMA